MDRAARIARVYKPTAYAIVSIKVGVLGYAAVLLGTRMGTVLLEKAAI